MDDEGRALAGRLLALSSDRRARLAERIRASGADGTPTGPVPVPRTGAPMAASFVQERLWLVDQILPGSAAYVVPVAVRIRGPLDADRLRAALAVVLDRHEVLRSRLVRSGGRLVQEAVEGLEPPLEVLDLSTVDNVRLAAREALSRAATTGFRLDRAPLWRCTLVRLAGREHLLGLFVHHAVTDGWSNAILLSEIGAAYTAHAEGREPDLVPVPLQYADAAAWQRERFTDARRAELLRYWLDQLADAPTVLHLPSDRPRRTGANRGAEYLFTVPPPVVRTLTGWASRERASRFALVLAGVAGVLARWAGVDDVVVGSPQTSRDHPALEAVVGPFVNTVVLRMRVPAGMTGRELLRAARVVSTGAAAHSDLPFEKLVEALAPARDPAYNPVFQINLGVSGFPQESLLLPWTTVEPVSLPGSGATKFDLSVYLTDGGDEWYGTVEYNADMFDEATVADRVDAVWSLLAAAAADPDRPLTDPSGDRGRMPVPTRPRQPAPARFVAPRDHWERLVADVWSDVLGGPELGANDHFFVRGGHSIAAMLATDRIHQETGRRVALTALFENPTVAEFATLLRASDDGVTDLLVTLGGADGGAPVVFMPGAVGELGMYHRLVRALADRLRCPLVGVRPDAFVSGADGDLSLREMARRYAEALVSAYPEGPYHLCGYSAAGRLAVAVAEALEVTGHRPGAVILLDTAPFGDVAADPSFGSVLARWFPFAPAEDELAGLGREAQIDATLSAGKRLGDLPANLDTAQFTRLCRRLELGARALAGHLDPRCAARPTLLVRSGPDGADIAARWGGTAAGPVRVRPVDVASHLDFVEGPRVPDIADVVAEIIAGHDAPSEHHTEPVTA